MANDQTTIRELLTTYKPLIDCTASGMRPTTSTKWPNLGNIKIWEDFTLAIIDRDFGFALDDPFTIMNPRPAGFPLPVGHQINSLADLNALFKRNVDMLDETLVHARMILDLHFDKPCASDYATAQGYAKFLTIRSNMALQHAIWLEHQPILNILAGLGKTSKQWCGSALQKNIRNNDEPSQSLLWPVRQLANICNKANTRFGYIQTDKELVVFEFTLRADEKREAPNA
ncbi:hypothetical protein H2204_001955 [Knufia peltigerae]|uniref:Uncharacterized protein n=1 Tax=Knufia peltigerae TaxID=1002370 RepID=A0AA39D130_9EURO|nr:hypothetical protein H2204_001955 [Knufia peltigerae]